MTNEKLYIFEIIRLLSKKYQSVGIKYEFKEKSNAHLIQISPESIFDLSDFKNLQIDFIQDFYTKFPESSIAFITQDSLVTVEHPEIEIKNNLPNYKSPDVVQQTSEYEVTELSHTIETNSLDTFNVATDFMEHLSLINQVCTDISLGTESTALQVDKIGNVYGVAKFQINYYSQEKNWIKRIASIGGKKEIASNYDYALAA